MAVSLGYGLIKGKAFVTQDAKDAAEYIKRWFSTKGPERKPAGEYGAA